MTGLRYITDTLRLYPPGLPSLWGRWTRLALICITIGRLLRRYVRRAQPMTPGFTDVPAVFTLEQRRAELLSIDTSIRTPQQKAEAVFAHFQIFLSHTYGLSEQEGSLTSAELEMKQVDPIYIDCYQQLAALIYAEKKPQHHLVHTIVQTLSKAIQHQ